MKKIIRDEGGELTAPPPWLAKVPGQEKIFTVPMSATSHLTSPRRSATFLTTVNRYHRTILVVENEESYAYLIEKAFQANGVTDPIHWVDSAAEAIRYFMGEGKYSDRDKFAFPSFIMTDLRMRERDGFAVLQHLKANPEWKVIPTVVFTTSAEPDDIKKVYMLGASSFHQKPGDYDSLRRQLKILHDYWMTCFIPEVDSTGRQMITDSEGELGERFPQSSGAVQKRHKPPQ